MDKPVVLLSCGKCKRKNYSTVRSNRQVGSSKLKINKFCPFCRSHTEHKETKA